MKRRPPNNVAVFFVFRFPSAGTSGQSGIVQWSPPINVEGCSVGVRLFVLSFLGTSRNKGSIKLNLPINVKGSLLARVFGHPRLKPRKH